MSLARLRGRTPSATPLGGHVLYEHDLRFHKVSHDGSGKCDAFFTGGSTDLIHGALFDIDPNEKHALDKAEGLGIGYEQKIVQVLAADGCYIEAMTYFATHTCQDIKPYSWYLHHVHTGALETQLPSHYIQTKISIIEALEDPDKKRDNEQRAIHTSR